MGINWLLFVRSLVAGFLQRSYRLAWLDVVVSPIRKVYNKFRLVTDDAEFAATHSCLKIYLEKALNDKFDPGNRTIYIENVDNLFRTFVYSKAEARRGVFAYKRGEPDPMGIPPTYRLIVMGRLEYFGTNDFIVHIGSAVVFNEGALRQFIDSFKPAGKRYTINIY